MQGEKADMETQLKSFARVNEALVNMLLETKQRAGEETDPVVAIRQRQVTHSTLQPPQSCSC